MHLDFYCFLDKIISSAFQRDYLNSQTNDYSLILTLNFCHVDGFHDELQKACFHAFCPVLISKKLAKLCKIFIELFL